MYCSGVSVWCAVLLLCGARAARGAAAGAGVGSGAGAPCGPAHDFFRLANVSADGAPKDTDGATVCGGACCSARQEAVLRVRVRKDFSALAAHTSRALHGLLATTRHTLHDHVTELSKQSQNKTHVLFTQVYKSMALHAQKPIDDLYLDIRNYVQTNHSELGSAPSIDIERTASEFFKNIFPLVYHKAVKQDLQHKDFSGDYKNCLKEAFKEIQPFGDIPSQISKSLSKSLDATRVLLQALNLGSEVLTATDELLAEDTAEGDPSGSSCHAALLRMSYCGKCRGLPLQVKPCAGYCLNVLRGCVTWRVAELDLPWNSYVEGVERLVTAERSPDGRTATGDAALRPLDRRISEAIMHAMENGINLEKKVKHSCGHARLVDLSEDDSPGALSRGTPGLQRRDQVRVSPPDTQITHFLASIAKSKGFYINLADTLCKDESFAEQNDVTQCWNGEHVGEYTKTVVGPGASLQKYNPEVAVPAAAEDSRVTSLADKLRHVRQLLVSQVSSPSPTSESFSYMQGDEAGGGEGSGSGRDDYGDGEDDTYDGEGSGEGSGAIESTESKDTSAKKIVPVMAGAASWRAAASPLLCLVLGALLTLLRRCDT